MARILVDRKSLERIALQQMRSLPGGEFVIAVEVETLTADEMGANWGLCTYVNQGCNNLEVVQRATSRTRQTLQNQYNLVPEVW